MTEKQPGAATPAPAHGHDSHGGHGDHDAIVQYVLVFLALMLLTAVTVWVSWLKFDNWSGGHLFIAMTVAAIKATMIVLIFMHVWGSSPLIKVIIFASILTLGILLCFTYADYWSRGRSGIGIEAESVRVGPAEPQ